MPGGETIDVSDGKGAFRKWKERNISRKKVRMLLITYRVFSEFLQVGKKDVNKVKHLKGNKKTEPSETHFTAANLIFPKKAIRKLEGVLTK